MATVRPLFGGALSVELPHRFQDISEFRDVPDAQEVFADAGTDQSVIVEVLQHSAGVGDADAAAFHFNDIAESNGVAAGDVTLQPSADVDIAACMPALCESLSSSGHLCSSVTTVAGVQRIAKFKEGSTNCVRVQLVCVRLPSVRSDVLLTLNTPLSIDPQSSSAPAVDPGVVVGADGVVASAVLASADEVMSRALSTLAIHDWSVFGGSEDDEVEGGED